jgi:hypothetical protein
VLGSDIGTRARRYVIEWADTGRSGLLILTGNAGTGKTALVEAYCGALGVDRPTHDALVEVAPGKFAVKDLSGMKAAERAEVVHLSREICSGREAQLFLCANEGVLRETLRETPDLGLEDALNLALDAGASAPGADHGVVVVNMNRQRWTAPEIWASLVDYFVRQELWEDCADCEGADACPIRENAQALRQQSPREAARRLVQLASGDSVSTLRELLSILSHGITGGLDCAQVKSASQPFDAQYGYFNLLLGGGLSKERLERSTLIQAVRRAGLGSVSDVEVDGWLREAESAPPQVSAIAEPSSPSAHALVKTSIGNMTFGQFGEMISVSDDPAKVAACMQDYVEGMRVLELWRRRVFFEAHSDLGGWSASFSRLTTFPAFGELIDASTELRTGRDATDIRRSLILGLNSLAAGFAEFGGSLVVPDPGSLAARNPGSFRLPEPSMVHSRVRVERIALESEDKGTLLGMLDTDDVRVVLRAEDSTTSVSSLVITPRLFEVIIRSGRFMSPAGRDLPEMNELVRFYSSLSTGPIDGPLEVVDPSHGVIKAVTLPAL